MDLNPDNALGWGGKVAHAYGDLIQQMWRKPKFNLASANSTNFKSKSRAASKAATIAPRRLKRVIGEIQQRFSGNQQQDSSELLAFLLDGLHEDLNRGSKFCSKTKASKRPRVSAPATQDKLPEVSNAGATGQSGAGQDLNKSKIQGCRHHGIQKH